MACGRGGEGRAPLDRLGRPPRATARPPRFRAEERLLPGRTETWLTGIATPALETVVAPGPNGVGFADSPGATTISSPARMKGPTRRAFAAMGYTAGALA